MQSLESLKAKLESLKSSKIRLSAQIDSLRQQEDAQRAKLAGLGITNVDQALADLTVESNNLKASIDNGLRACGV